MMKPAPIVYVVDDDKSFRESVGELLNACGYQTLLFDGARQLLAGPISSAMGCILLDVKMDGLSGPQLQNDLVDRGCMLPVVFISGYKDVPVAVQTIKAGAEDFLTKPVAKDRLLEVIERALARYEERRAQQDEIFQLRSRMSELTPREREVFDHLVRGLPHKQIAYVLSISERTVKLHRHQIVRKLQVRSLADLAVIAERLGLLPNG
jgi:RNA polymerase sigma factor (sigma-70 family)